MSLDELSRNELIDIIKRYQNYFQNGGVDLDVFTQLDLIEKMKFTEERFRLVFYTSPDSININRAHDGLYIDVNEGFTNLTGYSRFDVLGKTSIEIDIWCDLKDRDRLRELIKKNGKVTNYKAKFRMKDGSIRVGLMSAIIIEINNEPHIISITKDIHSTVKMEERLRKHQEKLNQINKLEAMSEMAGNIGHEFKNYITIMRSAIEIMKMENKLEDDLIETVFKYIDKANNLSKDLIHIKAQSDAIIDSDRIDPISAIIELKPIFQNLSKNAKIQYNLMSKSEIEIDKKMLEKILINLLLNAVDATPNGNIDIITEDVLLSSPIDISSKKEYVRIIIKDDGCGISENDLQKIFDPFFTNKKNGSGLGLTIVHRLVTQNSGYIEVDSKYGEGTSFCIDFPVKSTN